MMRAKILTGLACVLAMSSVSWADDQNASDSYTGTSTTEVQPERGGTLGNEKFGVIPQIGFMTYSDFQGNSTSRATFGATMEFKAPIPMLGGAWSTGLETGVLFSHWGAATSNLFGSSPDVTVSPNNSAGANFILVPLDVKLGYVFNDMFLVGAHGGLNFTYRSAGDVSFFGSNSVSSGGVWRPYPNVGGDVQIQFLRNVAFILRPDVTITPGNDLFTGTIGLNIFLG